MTTRVLTVQEGGVDYRVANRPLRIRLRGQWLRRLGFAPGQKVEITVFGPGVLEVRLLSISPPPSPELSAIASRIDAALDAAGQAPD